MKCISLLQSMTQHILINKIKNLTMYFSHNEPSSGQTERNLCTFNVCAHTLNVPRPRSVWPDDGWL
jgi:hypothetical protein